MFLRNHKNTPKVWTCPFPRCGKSYSLKSNMLQHTRSKHPHFKMPAFAQDSSRRSLPVTEAEYRGLTSSQGRNESQTIDQTPKQSIDSQTSTSVPHADAPPSFTPTQTLPGYSSLGSISYLPPNTTILPTLSSVSPNPSLNTILPPLTPLQHQHQQQQHQRFYALQAMRSWQVHQMMMAPTLFTAPLTLPSLSNQNPQQNFEEGQSQSNTNETAQILPPLPMLTHDFWNTTPCSSSHTSSSAPPFQNSTAPQIPNPVNLTRPYGVNDTDGASVPYSGSFPLSFPLSPYSSGTPSSKSNPNPNSQS